MLPLSSAGERARLPFHSLRAYAVIRAETRRNTRKPAANLAKKLATFTDRFSPRTAATYNNNDIMVAKLEGPFHRYKHDNTDDFFVCLVARSISSYGIGPSSSTPAMF